MLIYQCVVTLSEKHSVCLQTISQYVYLSGNTCVFEHYYNMYLSDKLYIVWKYHNTCMCICRQTVHLDTITICICPTSCAYLDNMYLSDKLCAFGQYQNMCICPTSYVYLENSTDNICIYWKMLQTKLCVFGKYNTPRF